MTNDKDSAVTQADKDAAARLNGYASWRTWEVLQQHDDEWMMLCAQDFAKHRIASSQPTQSDALRDQLLQECLVKLRDVQGTAAPKQYACNLIKRIERVLHGQSK
jgi:hypothetical protein